MANKFNELMEFPAMYTFKIVGFANDTFRTGVAKVFSAKEVHAQTEKNSKDNTYVSVSVVCTVDSADELELLYTAIRAIPELKFYL